MGRLETTLSRVKGARRLSLIVSALAAGGYLATLLRERATANAYGTSAELDSYLVAYTLVTFVALTPSRALYDPLVVVVAAERERDLGRQAALARAALAGIAIVLALLTALLLSVSPMLPRAIAPGMSPGALTDASRLVVVLAPVVVAMGIWEVSRATLHAYGEFIVSSLVPIIGTLTTLVVVVLWATELGINALAVGVVAASVLQVAVAALALARHGVLWRGGWPSWRELSPLWAPIGAGLVLTAASSLSTVIDRYLGSQLPAGRIAALNYASRMTDVATIISITGVATVVYPRLAQLHARGLVSQFGSLLRRSILGSLLIALPMGIGLALLAEPTVTLLFGTGRFGVLSQRTTAEALAAYAIALPVIAAATLLARALYALRRLEVLLAQAAVFLVAKAIVGVLLLVPLEHVGVALANGAGYVSAILLMAIIVRGEMRRAPEGEMSSPS